MLKITIVLCAIFVLVATDFADLTSDDLKAHKERGNEYLDNIENNVKNKYTFELRLYGLMNILTKKFEHDCWETLYKVEKELFAGLNLTGIILNTLSCYNKVRDEITLNGFNIINCINGTFDLSNPYISTIAQGKDEGLSLVISLRKQFNACPIGNGVTSLESWQCLNSTISSVNERNAHNWSAMSLNDTQLKVAQDNYQSGRVTCPNGFDMTNFEPAFRPIAEKFKTCVQKDLSKKLDEKQAFLSNSLTNSV